MNDLFDTSFSIFLLVTVLFSVSYDLGNVTNVLLDSVSHSSALFAVISFIFKHITSNSCIFVPDRAHL